MCVCVCVSVYVCIKMFLKRGVYKKVSPACAAHSALLLKQLPYVCVCVCVCVCLCYI